MYNLPTPVLDHVQEYLRVSSTRRPSTRDRLLELRPTVETAYQRYINSWTRLETLSPASVSTDDRSKLQSNFDQLNKGASCEDVRLAILAATKGGECPYCRLQEAITLDHILTKATFPEFSVFRANLAPCCSQCNTTKQHNAGATASYPVFHLYSLGYPAAPFLDVDVHVLADRVRFDFFLVRPPHVDQHWFDALEGHFKSVNLGQRYGRKAMVEMQDLAACMRDMHAVVGAPGVRRFLLTLASSHAANWSAQDWRYALLSKAGDSAAFCDAGIFLI